MNKNSFLEELEKVTGLSHEKVTIINDIIESHFIVGKTSKDKIIGELVNQLGITEVEAESLYEKSMSIIAREIKSKIKHPFKSLD